MVTTEKMFYVVYMEGSVLPMPFVPFNNLEEAESEAKRVQYGTGRNVWVLQAKTCIKQPAEFDKINYK